MFNSLLVEKFVYPPKPTEESLTEIITREITFPNGRTVRWRMSRWHWEMIAFIELWNEYYKREHSYLYECFKRIPNSTDEVLSNGMMMTLRDGYKALLDETAPGEEPAYPDPRQTQPE